MRRGWIMGGSAYLIWGMSALYWPLLTPASTTEILAHRAAWSFVALIVLATVLGRWQQIRAHLQSPRAVLLLCTASALMSVNWGVFIWATTHDRVVEASLGYFVAPLVMVAIGVQAFHERPTRRQWAAVGLATCGVVVVTIAHGSPPWIALVLALTFAFYGWVKKQLGVAAVDGMTIETGVMFAPALVYIVYTQVHGTATFGHESPSHSILMIGASLVMFLPMLLFSAASRLIPLSTLGLMQYIEPGVQFLLGILAFHEAIPTSTWVAFVFIWAAVAALIYDALRTAKRALDAREAEGQVGISFTE